MDNEKDAFLDHLEWLVKCRSQNQQTSLVLFKIIENNSAELRKSEGFWLSHVGITLIAVSFSLWRAVFLANRTDLHQDVFDDAFKFLSTLIGDNAVSHVTDKNAREWTFRYYLNNAGFRLLALSMEWPAILPGFKYPNGLSPQSNWEHYQKSLDLAVHNFGDALKKSKKVES